MKRIEQSDVITEEVLKMKSLGVVLLFALFSSFAMGESVGSPLPPEPEVYVVQKGDTIEKIAREKFEDARLWVQLAKYNSISDSNLIKVGQRILIPSKAQLIMKVRERDDLEARVEELERQLSKLQGSTLELLLEDSFEDDKLAEKPRGWLFPSGGRWGISSDQPTFGSRMLEQSNKKAPNSAALVGENGWSNYIVQVEAMIGHSGEAGVFAYWNSHLENYRLRTGDRHKRLEIVKRVARGPEKYDTITLSRIPYQLEDKRWYIFKFEVTTHDSYTYLKGKVWRKGETEPGTWLLEASDHSSERYGSGLAGVWTISIGESYRGARFDNFMVQMPAHRTD